ncbi:glycerophosphocholine phosphodiesterase GPCPD1-like [Scylla paramamosain]|uniref:glycerophosphocholine phosphodiesterase GPCPD1-like n=1 Tax=Scylla paramamosain TaxID=85552 RepID=UPI003082718D
MVYHKKEKGLSKFQDEDFEDHQPFPTLQKALEVVPHTCGFSVEVKWTMQMRDGTYELQHPFELNNFLDLIIKMILEHSDKRKIVFSCFHPDICTMLRLKQNRYPVMFLTQGVSEVWPPYEDQRTNSVQQAILYAVNADILGINVHTEDLMRDPSQITAAMEHNLIVFCWGDHNNDQENIKFLKKVGLHGIIYDKIDVYNTKDKKESIFLFEEQAAADELVRGEEEKKKEEEEEVAAAAAAAANLAPSAARVMQGGGGESARQTSVLIYDLHLCFGRASYKGGSQSVTERSLTVAHIVSVVVM